MARLSSVNSTSVYQGLTLDMMSPIISLEFLKGMKDTVGVVIYFVQYTQFEHTIYPPLTMIYFVMFMLLMPILLLNMLIAMMGQTYTDITANSEKEWVRQWAKIVMVLERAFSKDALLKYQDQYSVPVDNPPKNESEHMSKNNSIILTAFPQCNLGMEPQEASVKSKP